MTITFCTNSRCSVCGCAIRFMWRRQNAGQRQGVKTDAASALARKRGGGRLLVMWGARPDAASAPWPGSKAAAGGACGGVLVTRASSWSRKGSNCDAHAWRRRPGWGARRRLTRARGGGGLLAGAVGGLEEFGGEPAEEWGIRNGENFGGRCESSVSFRASMAPNLSSDVHTASNDTIQFPSKPTTAAVDDIEAAAHGSADRVDYLARAQWLRAAVLGANDGLVSVASLMIGVGAVNDTARAMLVSGLSGLVAGACSMAIGEFVSVHAQYDIQVAHAEQSRGSDVSGGSEESLPSPTQAAGASALAFAAGAALPLLSGGFVRPWAARVAAVCAASSLGLAGFGAAGAYLGGANVVRSAARVLVGGWLAMAVTFAVLKLFSLAFKMHVSSA
ncbi:vacuolar iron transporter homolog 1-like [Phragmites australis]|uniref:vacuolar iron transporter homolog 1-like n=1 Tax=Phragmites australis TaxID=29695 RepID=UPI002D781B54|nr:vacuolar iron transporter homolog 1-like [Phragmites australis]